MIQQILTAQIPLYPFALLQKYALVNQEQGSQNYLPQVLKTFAQNKERDIIS